MTYPTAQCNEPNCANPAQWQINVPYVGDQLYYCDSHKQDKEKPNEPWQLMSRQDHDEAIQNQNWLNNFITFQKLKFKSVKNELVKFYIQLSK